MQPSITDRLAAAINELGMRATHPQEHDVIDVIKEARDHIARMNTAQEEFSSRIAALECAMSGVVNREDALADARGTLRRVAEALSERFCPHHGLGTCREALTEDATKG